MFMVGIHHVLNGNCIVLSLKSVESSYTNVMHSEELINFINRIGGPDKPYILTIM
jgi:hypothetical protein